MSTDTQQRCITVWVLLCACILAVWSQGAAGETKGEEYLRRAKKFLSPESTRQDRTEGIRWLRKAAEEGEAEAQVVVGVMYSHGGVDLPQNHAEAVRWFRKAAEQGDAHGQVNLGWMYENGQGVPQSDTEAVKWCRKAAEQGDKQAQDILRERGLSWTVRSPEQEATRADSPTPPSPPAAKERAPASKIPDDLGDLD